jgi:hypothetical protein
LTYEFEAGPKRKLGAGLGLALAAALIALPGQALGAGSGGIDPSAPPATVPGGKAQLVNGVAVAPADAPPQVVRAIEAGNRIVDKGYCLGGGHSRWESRCYDCSGTVSYTLGKKGARVLDAPMPSGGFMRWEERGKGSWITTYANPGHMYVVIAGLRLDTSQTRGDGPGWSKVKLKQRGYKRRHPAGL